MSKQLWPRITTEENFYAAWQKVRSNVGAPGVDRVTIEEFEQNLHENLALLRQMVQNSSYEPLPLVSFEKEKSNKKIRTLYISALRDKVVQQAILQVIQPVFEKIFLDCSYAYRPGKSQQKAVERVDRNLKRGRTWVFDADITRFFDEIDRELLLEFLAETITEKQVLAIIQKTIQLVGNANDKGVPQGLVLAPMLSNVYLHKMDDRMMRAEWNYIRYSDNILVLDRNEAGIKRARERAEECIREVRLEFNPEKTRICQLKDGFSFLGFYFDEHGKRPDEPALKRLDQKIGHVLHRAAEFSDLELKQRLDSIIRGWLNYFKLNATDKQKLLVELEQKFTGQPESIPQKIVTAALAYQLGDRNRARSEINSVAAVTSEDAEINYQWGIISDVLEMPNEAFDAYLTAFRLNSEHPEAAYRLGLHYLQQQQFESAIRYLKKAVQVNPQNAAIQFALGTAFQRHGLNGPAQLALKKATRLNPRIGTLLAKPAPKIKSKPHDPQINYSENDIAAYLRAFNGREGVYARQWLNSDGKIGYQPVYQHISADDIQAHLAGKETLAYYLLRMDNTVCQIIFDLDVTRQARTEVAKQGEDLENWRQLLQSDVNRILQVLQEFKITGYVEDSGFKGQHIWVFFAEPQPARDAVLLGKKIFESIGNPPPGLQREIFPGISQISPQALGPMMKLPLGIHKLTQKRCYFLAANGEPLADQLAVIQNICFVTTNQFQDALQKLKSPPQIAAEKMNAADRAKIDKILEGCNVLRFLKEKAESEKMLAHIDRLTLLATFGHLGESGQQFIHEVISHTLNYSFRITEKWIRRQKGLPVSCPRIREWQSHITPSVGCFCKFPNQNDSYPSPVLHADPDLIRQIKARQKSESKPEIKSKPVIPPSSKPAEIKTPHPIDAALTPVQPVIAHEIETLFQEYLDLKNQVRENARKIQEIEQKLDQLCQKFQCEQFSTRHGRFSRIQTEGKIKWILEI